jgi:AcrR family transcriptional regulator
MEELKEKIVSAAFDLFNRYGIRSVSMDDIARHLGISKKTIYTAFTDKDEIVTAVTEEHISQFRKEYDSIVSSSENAIEELAKFTVHLRRSMSELNPALLYDLSKYHRVAWQRWVDYKNGYIRNCIVANLKHGVDQGHFRKEIDVAILSAFRVESVQMAFDPQVFPPERFAFADVQLQLFDHFVHGLLTESGRKLYHEYRAKISQPIPQFS